tara:strand:- start:803 stop:1474 length:672 start_codon:yes stop_codon:yes gene_type:complete
LDSPTIITIDGYASSGKSTQAKMLSKHYQIPFIDSGSLYRSITLYALENQFLKEDVLDQSALKKELDGVMIRFDHQTGKLYLNGENISKKIRLTDVSDNVSTIAALSFVRNFVLLKLRKMAINKGLVVDGRDVGTVVFPHADYKFFFNARPEIRAQRRFEELKAKGQNITLNEVFENLIQRDALDSERDIAPLRKAKDAIEIDTSKLTTDEVFAFLIKKIDSK